MSSAPEVSMSAAPQVGAALDTPTPRQWTVQAVAAGDTHIDALSIDPVTGTDLGAAAAEVCARLPVHESPFGAYYLLAVATVIAAEIRPILPLICPVHRRRDHRGWDTGSWRPARHDSRFVADRPWEQPTTHTRR